MANITIDFVANAENKFQLDMPEKIYRQLLDLTSNNKNDYRIIMLSLKYPKRELVNSVAYELIFQALQQNKVDLG